jgi:hypothetical protein
MLKKSAAIFAGLLLAAGIAVFFIARKSTESAMPHKPEQFVKDGSKDLSATDAQIAPRAERRRYVETTPRTPEDTLVQEKVWSLVALPEASSMESSALAKKFEQLGFDFEIKSTESQRFGTRTDYILKEPRHGIVELILSYDKSDNGERLLGLRATIPASQIEATKRVLDSHKGDAKVSHQMEKFLRFERTDGYVLWLKTMDEETVDGENDMLGTAKLGLEPAQE